MPYLRAILVSIAMACVGDFVALKLYPQSGSRVYWTVSHLKNNLMKFRNVTHKFADAFCNQPKECKDGMDEFFQTVGGLPEDVLDYLANILNSPKSQEDPQKKEAAVQKNREAAIREAVNYGNTEVSQNNKGADTTEGEGNLGLKATSIVKSLTFSTYDENNLCDVKQGISPDEYDVTVDEVADLTNMPLKLKKTIKRARNFTGGNVLAVNKLHFKDDDGNLVFGRVAVIRRGKVLDMAYSLHSVEYKLKQKQKNPADAQKFEEFAGSLGKNEGESEAFEGITVDLREDFLAFFHKQAVDGFSKHCKFVFNALTDHDKGEVLQALGVKANDNGDRQG